MRLRRAAMRPFALPLMRGLSTAHGVVGTRRGWLVWLEDERGRVGVGEATPLADFGTESHAACEAALGRILRACLDGSERAFEERLGLLEATRWQTPCAVGAVDTALHDLAARSEALFLADWLRHRAGKPGPSAGEVPVQALIGGETPGMVAEAARCAGDAGFSAFKLKLAVSCERREVVGDLARVAALRAVVGPEARLRLDANEAWTRAEAVAALESLAPFDIDYVEQPVAREDRDSLAWLAARSPVAVAADEALLGTGLEACLALEAISILIVKPAALGGIDPSRRLVERAEARGLRVVWSTLLDGAVGRAAVWHLAAGLGPDDEVHGLATGGWLARDLGATPQIREGRLGSPGAGPGLGLPLGPGSAGPSGSGPGPGGGTPAPAGGTPATAGDTPWVGPARCFGGDG